MKQLLQKILFVLFLAMSCWLASPAQNKTKTPVSKPEKAETNKPSVVKTSPAYAEVLLRKTDLEANLEDFLVEYTDEYPKVKETRYELGLLNKELERLLAVNPNEAGKLTLALGKLIVRKAQLDTDLWLLQQRFADEHEDVKRARRKVVTFEKAIREILP